MPSAGGDVQQVQGQRALSSCLSYPQTGNPSRIKVTNLDFIMWFSMQTDCLFIPKASKASRSRAGHRSGTLSVYILNSRTSTTYVYSMP